jgi:hypothetical protein
LILPYYIHWLRRHETAIWLSLSPPSSALKNVYFQSVAIIDRDASKYMLSCVHPARVWLDVAKVATNGLGTSPSLHQSDKSYTEVDDRLTNEAQRILRGDRSVNLPERRSAYEESGWMGFDPRAEPLEDIEAERDRVP